LSAPGYGVAVRSGIKWLDDFFCLNQKFLVYNIVSRNLKLRYRRSALGYFWTLIVPLSTAGVYYFVFNVLHKSGTRDYAMVVILGVLTWAFFSGTLSEGMNSISANLPLLSQISVPLHLFPFCSAVTQLIVFLFSIPALMGFMIFYHTPLTWHLFWIPYYIFILFISSYSLSFLLALSFVYVRDLKQVMAQVLHIWLYLTPVIYRGERLEKHVPSLAYLNPVGKAFSGLQRIVLDGHRPRYTEMGIPLFWAGALLIVALIVKDKASKLAVEKI
jgi:ABC-type polysaccharide/polyol phosphate export permease